MPWWARWGTAGGYLLVGVLAPIADLVGLVPLDLLDDPVVLGVGVALAGLGIVATFAAQVAMGSSERIGVDTTERTTLVTHGPFRLVRNPIFSAVTLAFLGLTLMVPNVLAIAGLVVVLVGTQLRCAWSRKPYLRQVHGAAYADYASAWAGSCPASEGYDS